ncbi:hypothetical protein BCR36DRAFT_252010, partial [Piromyces finnis]
MNVYPYCVFNNVYNFNSSFPFLIVMLNTSKLYTFPNYRYEYVVGPKDNLFSFNEDIINAILSMYKKNSISIIDNKMLSKYIKQYVIDTDNKTVFITEKEYSKENCYLWRSIYSEVIPKIPIVKDANEFYNTLPSFSFLYESDEKFIVYGIWENEIYYPCKSSLEILKSNNINKPYLLIKRNLD